jgi:hypothetical protein
MEIKKASTDISVYFHLRDSSDGTSKTGLVYNSAGAVASYVRNGAARTAITLATLASASAAHADGGFILVDDTNTPGLYRLDLPDAAVATGVDSVIINIGFTGVFGESLRIDLVDNTAKDVYDIVNNGTYGNAQLVRATTPANTLDVAATGEAGIDFDNINGTHPTVPTVTNVTNQVTADVTAISGDSPAADNLEAAFDNTGYNLSNSTIGTCTTNTDMRGTDSALLAASAPTNFGDMSIAVTTGLVDIGKNSEIDAIKVVTDDLTSTAALVDAVWDEAITTSVHNGANSAGKKLRTVSSDVVREATAQGPGTGNNQIQLDASASAVDGSYDPSAIAIIGGVGIGQSRLIIEYDGATKTATVDRDWKVNPDATSDFIITSNPGREHVNEGLAQAGSNNTITLNSLASASNDVYIGQIVFIRSGTGQDQAKVITAYNGTSKVATVDSNWAVNPDTTSGYIITPTQTDTLTEIGTAVWATGTRTLTAGTKDAEIDNLVTRLGVPADIDGGGATVADNLKKFADDNGGASFDAGLHSLKELRDRGDAAWVTYGGTGSGANNFNITVKKDNSSGATLSGVDVQVMDSGETTTLTRQITNTSGLINVDLDNGTYHMFFRLNGYIVPDPGNPITLTVTGATDQEDYMELFNPGSPASADQCIVTITLSDAYGDPLVGEYVQAKLADPPQYIGSFLVSDESVLSSITNANGVCTISLPQGLEYDFKLPNNKKIIRKTVASSSTANFEDLP